MRQLRAQEEFRATGYVSIWLGNFVSELDEGGLDEYFPQQFEQDFGFEVYPPAGPEYDISEEGPKPVRELIDGCYQSERYLEEAVALCQSRGWSEATTILLFLHLRYDPTGIMTNSAAPATFIGSVAMRQSGT